MVVAPTSRVDAGRTSRYSHPAGWRQRILEVGLALFVACALAWWIGLLVFVRAIPETVEDGESRTDAIVVLTGGAERLATGLALFAADKAGAIFVSGVNPQVGISAVLRAAGANRFAPLIPQVQAGYRARDTVGNAAETAAWMRRRGYQSLRLVTSDYHMPRSRLEFARAMPDVRIIPHPVFAEKVIRPLWWRRPNILGMIVVEYNKLLLSALTHAVSRVLAFAGA